MEQLKSYIFITVMSLLVFSLSLGCAVEANSRGMAGLFFGLLPIVIVSCLSTIISCIAVLVKVEENGI